VQLPPPPVKIAQSPDEKEFRSGLYMQSIVSK
jgi:hypothetical protein